MINIIIADDHDIIRQGLRSIILSQGDYCVAAEARDGQEALSVVEKYQPEAILLDITMPKMTGLDIVAAIKKVSPKTKILIISVHKAEAYIAKALSLGVRGYLIKDNAASELLPALKKIMDGEVYFGSGVSAYFADKATSAAGENPRLSDLTPREQETLRLVAEGKTAKEIAKVLGISPRTVENNKNSLLKKLGLHRTVDIVRYAIENGLID